MYILYIDESGDTIPLSQDGKKYLVLTGAIFCENEILPIQKQFRELKQRYFQDPNIEIKSNFLRYANPDIEIDSPLKLNSRGKYDELEEDVSKILKEIPTTLYSVIIDKRSYWEQYPAQNPYDIAYIFLLERFQKFLQRKEVFGICIIDPREGQVEKHFIGNELSRIHRKMRWQDGEIWNKCPNIVEKLLFSESDKTIGIQVADLFCYPVFNVFEYNKKPDEYWRFKELTYPKIYRHNGKVDGYGIKYFPDETKKDLRFYS